MDKYAELDKKLAFLLYPGLVTIFPDKLDEILEANGCTWTRDWSACGPLMVKYGCYPFAYGQAIGVNGSLTQICEVVDLDHNNADTAARVAVVKAVIAKLEGK